MKACEVVWSLLYHGILKNILSGYRISQLSQFEEQFGNLDEIQVKFIAL